MRRLTLALAAAMAFSGSAHAVTGDCTQESGKIPKQPILQVERLGELAMGQSPPDCRLKCGYNSSGEWYCETVCDL